MHNSEDSAEALIYKKEEPPVEELCLAYDTTISQLSEYFDRCQEGINTRKNLWPGKSKDQRKHGADAFPWEAASDLETNITEQRMSELVALLVLALKRANIIAIPSNATEAADAKVTTSFLKWMMRSGYIPRLMPEMELGANYMLERGILITYIGWHSEARTFLQDLSLEQIAEVAPDIAQFIIDPELEDLAIARIRQSFPSATLKRAKKAIRELRKEKKTKLPVVKREINAPEVKTLSPSSEFYFPPYVVDPQDAPYCFWKTHYTAQQIKNRVVTEGWDEDTANYIIEHHRGVNMTQIENNRETYTYGEYPGTNYQAEELIEIIVAYQRLIDPDDNSEGIYCTIFNREFLKSNGESKEGIKPYLKFELLNGFEDYPVEVTRFNESTKRLYDTDSIPQRLKGVQNQIKVEIDSQIDANSQTTLPTLLHPPNGAPKSWGPGKKVPQRRKGDFEFAPTPGYNTGSTEMRELLEGHADRLCGLSDDQNSLPLRQFFVDKYLTHVSRVINQCYRAFQRFGPDQIYFQATGSPDPQMFSKGDPDDNFDITVTFDVQSQDDELQEKKNAQLLGLLQSDKNGRIDPDRLIEQIASSIDPILSNTILRSQGEAQDEVTKNVTDDLAKIDSGIEMPARANGAQIALQIIQNWEQQEDIFQKMASSEAYAQRVQKYKDQYIFQMQQAQNAHIGKTGTQPASVGQVQTQNINQ